MKCEIINLTMSDGNVNVVHSYLPSRVEAVVLVSHGMVEHAARYEAFASFMCDKNIAVYVEDHRGHGETAKLAKDNGTGDFGYLADKNGFFRVVEDIHEEVLFLKDKYPGKKIILFGHSFGSFISQCLIEKYGDSIDGVVLCGTAGPRKALIAVSRVVGALPKLFAKKRPSKFMNKLAFGAYNAKIKNPKTEFDWLSRDEEQVQKYINDPWCGYIPTAGFFADMSQGLSYIHKNGNMKKIPLSLPVFFIDGDADPVGSYTKTVTKLCSIYKKNGMETVDIKFYEGARHELLNETNKEEIWGDVREWVERRVKLG